MRRLLAVPGLATALSVAPWVPLALIDSPQSMLPLLGASLILCAIAASFTALQRQPFRPLEILDTAYALLLLTLALPPVRDKLSMWAGAVSIAVVLVFALTTLVRAKPFTIAYTGVSPGVDTDPALLAALTRMTRQSLTSSGRQQSPIASGGTP